MNYKVTFTIFALFALYVPSTQGMSVTVVTGELYCKCINYVSTFIPLRYIEDFDIFPGGPQCPYTEVIATLKSGKQVCLMPESPWVKRIIYRVLNNN